MIVMLMDEKYDVVMEVFKDVMDFEFGINVVDFGFIYDFVWDDENDVFVIYMMLISVGCLFIDVFED